MTALSVCLIIVGIAAIVVSYFISDKVAEDKLKQKAEEIIMSTDSKEILLQQTKTAVDEILEELSEEVTESVERELQKMSNEKIMAVQDYSETVLNEINKNHNEVMFLYSMLDDKDKEIKQTVKEVRDTLKLAKRIDEISPSVNAIEEKTQDEVSVATSAAVAAAVVNASDTEYISQATVEDDMVGSVTSINENLTNDVNASQTLMPNAATQTATTDIEEENSTKDRKEEILKLGKEGYSDVEIAKKLNMGVGEVKLVLELFQGANK